MPATLTWVDSSEEQQRRMMELLNSWAEQGTLDELGIGTIRDAFSDFFFPGTSTIQTRARYMLLVPWMYLDLEAQRARSWEVARRAREYEGDIIEALNENCPHERGIIGAQAGRQIRQTPAGIYWAGLRSWGIRRFDGLRTAYHQQLDRHYERLKHLRRLDSEAQQETALPHNWHPKLPNPPGDWPKMRTLELRRCEAEFLRDRIMEEHPDSLLAHLIELGAVEEDVPSLWLLPQVEQLPPALQEEIDRARSFAELMQAADLVYALILADMSQSAPSPDPYRKQLLDWARENEPRRSAHARHANAEQWQAVQARRPATGALQFEREWRAHLLNLGDFAELANDPTAERIIREREVRVKGSRARVHGGRRLERWAGVGRVGTLGFRWPTARTIIADIVRGLGRDDHA